MFRNNHGWGLKEMLFLSAILLFFVLLIAVLVGQLYGNVGNETPSAYQKVEQNLVKAARRYYKDNESNYVTSDELVLEDYLSLKDLTVDDDICEGYVMIDGNTYDAYITCEHYETEGY